MENSNQMKAIDMVSEPVGMQSLDLFGLEDIFPPQAIGSRTISQNAGMTCQTGLKPIVKWPGGKEKELK